MRTAAPTWSNSVVTIGVSVDSEHGELPLVGSDDRAWLALAKCLRERVRLLMQSNADSETRERLMSRYLTENEQMFRLMQDMAKTAPAGVRR